MKSVNKFEINPKKIGTAQVLFQSKFDLNILEPNYISYTIRELET